MEQILSNGKETTTINESSNGETNELNVNPLNALQDIRGVLTQIEEMTFMNILFSSSASIRSGNFGLSRKEVEKQLGISGDEDSFFHLSKELIKPLADISKSSMMIRGIK